MTPDQIKLSGYTIKIYGERISADTLREALRIYLSARGYCGAQHRGIRDDARSEWLTAEQIEAADSILGAYASPDASEEVVAEMRARLCAEALGYDNPMQL